MSEAPFAQAKNRGRQMNFPILDRRVAADIMAEIKALAPQYVPEWRPDENEPDAGLAFARIFAGMMEDSIRRFNRVPYNHYLTFLNLAGAKLNAAVSASGLITVEVNPGSGGVHIEKGSLLYAPANNEEGRVFFATTEAMYALDTQLQSIVCTDPLADKIVKPWLKDVENYPALACFRAFDFVSYPNLQQHALYFAGGDLLFCNEGMEITMRLHNTRSARERADLQRIFANEAASSWHYYSGGEWRPITEVQYAGDTARLRLPGPVDSCEIEGLNSRFVRCLFHQRPEADILVTGVTLAPSAAGVKADFMVADSTVLPEQDALPFGEQFSTYSDFYIGSGEAFSKAGALVDISFNMDYRRRDMEGPDMSGLVRYKLIMNHRDFLEQEEYAISIERVIWEYWNGEGWARLFADNEGEDFFRPASGDFSSEKHLRFICPPDVQSLVVGAQESRYIRARIVRVNNAFKASGFYVCPYLHQLRLNYTYKDAAPPCRGMVAQSGMETSVFQEGHTFLAEKLLLGNAMGETPALVFCFSQAPAQGPARIFFDIKYRPDARRIPLHWEYYTENRRGEYGWEELEVQDATDGLSKSGVLTVIGRNNFKQAVMWGENGYFIRAVATGGLTGLTQQQLPEIQALLLNTVAVIQTDTPPPQYFSIESHEPHKECRLAYQNLSEATVWVNEQGSLSVDEEQEYLLPGCREARVERAAAGHVSELWVRWQATENLRTAGPLARVFEFDPLEGLVRFGDGRHGRIPTAQAGESICVEYAVSHGKTGNVKQGEIGGFARSIPFIDRVSNRYDMLGGHDAETVDKAARRMSALIGGMGRLVSAADIEQAIISNVPNTVRAKCLMEEGKLRVAVLPENFVMNHTHFALMRKKIENLLREKATLLNSAGEALLISEPYYIEVSASISVRIKDMNSYQDVYLEIKRKLDQFLHPIHGNFDGQGWKIGEIPRREIVYNYLKATEGIHYIQYFHLFAAQITAEGRVELDYDSVGNPLAVPVPGEHEIRITVAP